MSVSADILTKAGVLAEALPYIREFSGKTVVIKYGGHAMEDPALADLFAQDVVLMRLVGMNPVVVHGGGPQISDLMQRLGKVPEFVDGLRVTDAETVDIVRMALVGKVNREVVGALNQHGSLAVGLSGEDAGLITVKMRDERLGFVGDVTNIDASILERLIREELIPVVATVGVDVAGQAYNVNADTVAGAIAEAMTAEKLVYLTDVAGLYEDFGDETSLISRIDVEGLERLAQRRQAVGRDDPEDPLVRRRAPQRRVARAHPRRPHPARVAARVLHPGGHRHDDRTRMSAFDEIQQLDAEHVMQTYGRLPVAFVRGEGVKLWDSEGNEYLDFLGGLAVTALGHSHPAVADAVADQARTLLHVSNLYYNDVQPRVAARLDALLGGGGRVFFANSGAEANECAIKLSRRYGQANGGPERYHVLSALGSFHGRTLTTLAATGQPQKQETFQPLPSGFRQVGFGDLDALAAAMDERVCAVMLEPIQGEGGVLPSPPGYLEAVRALCDEREALLVIDEVQTGLGRTGKWFGFQHAPGVTPDIVSMAKALGNGVPIGACWARDEVAAAFKPGDHATTYGGQPLAARAALTVLEVMEAVDAPACANRAGARLSAGLAATPGVSVGARRGPDPRRRARAAARSAARRARPAARGAGGERGHADRVALRAVAARHRRRDRRCGRDRAQGAPGGCRMKPRHFLEVDDLTPAEFGEVLENASRWKSSSLAIPQHLEGLGVALLFEKPSARTRVSTEMAVFTMGGHPMYIRPDEVGLGVRESVADVARTMNALCGAIAARVFDHATLEEMASVVEIPVVNLLSDRAHPCQAVADFLTLQELVGDLDGRKLVFVGDGNNVAASLAYAAALSGVELTVASPVGLRARRRDRRPRPQPRWGHRARGRSRTKRCGAPTRSTPTCGRRWARKRRQRSAAPRSRATR